MSRSLHRARAVALSIAVALGVASVLTGCSSVEVETGDGGGTVAQAGDGTVPAAIDQTTTTKPGADPEQAGPGDELRQTYIDALLASYPDDGEPPWTDEAITCLAPKWVDAVGVDLVESGQLQPQAGVVRVGVAFD